MMPQTLHLLALGGAFFSALATIYIRQGLRASDPYAGFFGTVGGRLLRFVAIEKVGASIAAALINLNPFVSSALAIALLGEFITVPIVIGTVVIVAGTTLLSLGGKRLGFRLGQLSLPLL